MSTTGADLSGASLFDANLSGAGLIGADLSEVYLSGADLERASVTTDQLLLARSLEGATMPDDTKYEVWIKG